MGKKIVIVCGPRESYGFCPVPPINNSAPERNIFRLVENIDQSKFQVTVISACDQKLLDSIPISKSEVRYINIPFPEWLLKSNKLFLFTNYFSQIILRKIFLVPDFFSFFYLNKVKKVVREINPELILINSLPQYLNFSLKNLKKNKIGLFQRGELGQSRKYLDNLDLIITNSLGLTDYLRQYIHNEKVTIREMPNSLELSFSQKPKEIYSKKINKIIYTGRMIKDKGVFELIKAFRLVRNRFPEINLMIIGGHFDQENLSAYEKELISFSSENHLDVQFIKQVPNNLLSSYYQNADLAIFPSICIESFGMVALEAMRCGLPVIASKRPGFEYLITNNINGIILDDPENIESLANAIIDLIENPEKAISLGKNAFQRSLDFTPEKAAVEFEKIMDEFFNAK